MNDRQRQRRRLAQGGARASAEPTGREGEQLRQRVFDDEIWFVEHPDETRRERPAEPGELTHLQERCGPDEDAVVVVTRQGRGTYPDRVTYSGRIVKRGAR